MAAQYQLIGRKKVKTKAGRDFYEYYFSRPFSQYENDNAVECLGNAVETEGCSSDLPMKPGDIVELVFSKGYQGKAVLSGINMIKPHIK